MNCCSVGLAACLLLPVIKVTSTQGAQSPLREERINEIAAWLPAKPSAGPSITNRLAWAEAAKQNGWKDSIQRAEALSKQTLPALPDELYLEFSRNGNRTHWQSVQRQRDSRLAIFALAECVENRGRFIQPLRETIAAICAEKTWVMPAHDRSLANFKGELMDLDLRATLMGWELAAIRNVMGDALPIETRALIDQEVRRRVTQPFRDIVEGRAKGAYWLKVTHNWNAVCLAGVAGAALALEPEPSTRAWYAAAAEHFIACFLTGFTPDGYCSEGLGYWNYGYGRFVMLTEVLRQATGGKLDLLMLRGALPPATFPDRSEILNGIYLSVADCSPGTKPSVEIRSYLGRRLQRDERQPAVPVSDGCFCIDMALGFLPDELPPVTSANLPELDPLRSWFKDAGILICRSATADDSPFAVALKGGHNAEHHNHNDLGSFSVVAGRSMLVCDPGSEVYTARTFSGRRYDSKVLSSYGHAVPMLAGKMQIPGLNARARILEVELTPERDTLKFDLRSAYAVPSLKKFNREFTFVRGKSPSLKVSDIVEFSAPETYEGALVTWAEPRQGGNGVWLISEGKDGVQVRINTGDCGFKCRTETLNEDVPTARKPARMAITLTEKVEKAKIEMVLTPAQP